MGASRAALARRCPGSLPSREGQAGRDRQAGTGRPRQAGRGAFIYSGPDGIRGQIDPGEAVNVDPATLSDAERARLGARRLPDSLDAALNALEADDLLMTALGPLARIRGG